ncbi:MAG: hypothetical protein PHE06_07575 [Lachnospiraceae bacterium]|nr:hypothetical protein [Lachnospiraceae bacterium]
MMDEKILNTLREKNVILENGLSLDEIAEIEKMYEIVFPASLRNFLMMALPVSKGFYNWRNKEQDNVEFIKIAMNQPRKYIDEMPEEIYWCEDWGEEPQDKEVFKREVRKRLDVAPKLVPIFSHRYMPMIIEENPPIISIHGGDIIYMGENIEDYIDVEFGEKSQNEIDFSKIKTIPFWTDLM